MSRELLYKFQTTGVVVARSERFAQCVEVVKITDERGECYAFCFYQDRRGCYGERTYTYYRLIPTLADVLAFFRDTPYFGIGASRWANIVDLRKQEDADLPGVLDWVDEQFNVQFDTVWCSTMKPAAVTEFETQVGHVSPDLLAFVRSSGCLDVRVYLPARTPAEARIILRLVLEGVSVGHFSASARGFNGDEDVRPTSVAFESFEIGHCDAQFAEEEFIAELCRRGGEEVHISCNPEGH